MGALTEYLFADWPDANSEKQAAAVAALALLPRCLSHHDAHRRNLMIRNGPDANEPRDGLLLTGIDWSMVGPGAVGEDLAILIGVTLQFGDWPIADARPFADTLLSAYHAGLADAGSHVSLDDVRLGYSATAALVLGVGAIGVWETDFGGPEAYHELEGLLGASIDEIIGRFADLQDYFLDLGEQAITHLN